MPWSGRTNIQVVVALAALPDGALDRFARPADVGQLALYLASDAAQMITGEAVRIDAGLAARLYGDEHL